MQQSRGHVVGVAMTEWAALAGRTLMVGIPGPELDRETTGRLRTISPGGVILFRRNLESAQRTARLLGQLARVLPSPTLFAIDQEGGRVSRLEGLVGSTPTAATLAGLGAAAASGFAHATGEALDSELVTPEEAQGVLLAVPMTALAIFMGMRIIGGEIPHPCPLSWKSHTCWSA